ncbi:MAG: DUF3783 domain-containing protein [Caldisericaceae bacterium]
MEEKKFILLAGFSNEEIIEFLKIYKANEKLPKAIFASVTETALDWKVKDWLDELTKEDDYYKQNKQS